MDATTGKPTTLEGKRSYLEACGFIIGARDPRLNTRYPGALMVCEDDPEGYELPTEDGSNGPWCIVGDDLDAMIAEAFNVWYDDYEEAKNLERALRIAEMPA